MTQVEKNQRDLVREEFEFVSANLKMIVTKRAEQINYYERELLTNLLRKVIFIKESFDTRSPKFSKMAASLLLESHQQNDIVFKKNEPGEYFYIVVEGVYCVETENIKECKKTKNIFYYPGDSFGEVSLIYDVPRGATITAHKDSSLLKIPKAVFNECGNLERSICYLNTFFSEHVFFEQEQEFMIRVVASLSKLVCFGAEEVLVEEGQMFNELLFFAKGEAHIYKKLRLRHKGNFFQETIFVGKLRAGDVFGEKFYLEQLPSTVRIVSSQKGEFVRVAFRDNVSTVEKPLYRRIRQNALRFPSDIDYLDEYKMFLTQRIKQLEFLTKLSKTQSKAKKELNAIHQISKRIQFAELAS